MWRLTLVIIISLIGIISYTSFENKESINDIFDKGIEILKTDYSLEELDIDEYKTVLIYKILPFKSKVYRIKGLGIFSVLTLNLGIMEQISFNINPYEKDLPQLTVDYTMEFIKRNLRIEIYELMVNKEDTLYKNFLKKIDEIKEEYSELEDITLTKNWINDYLSNYILKSGSSKNKEKFLDLFSEVVETYMEYAKEAPTLSEDEQKKKYQAIKGFSDLLVENGGIAINIFKKSLGDEKTKEFLGKVIYGYLHIE